MVMAKHKSEQCCHNLEECVASEHRETKRKTGTLLNVYQATRCHIPVASFLQNLCVCVKSELPWLRGDIKINNFLFKVEENFLLSPCS